MDKLIQAVKRKLKITWDDADTDKRVAEIVSNAVPIVSFKLGAPETAAPELFATPGEAQNLLLNYCMYEWYNKVNEFDSNYANELFQARAREEVRRYEAAK